MHLHACTLYIHYTVTCDNLPIQLFYRNVEVVLESPIRVEGQFITYTCPSGFVLTGPNVSVCVGNGEWEPDPREVACIGEMLQLQYENAAIHIMKIYGQTSTL